MYHFIGIKGSGMASLAVILYDLGYDVNGSDIEKHFFTEEELIKRNIVITSYDKDNIKDDYIIIKGASIKEDNVELKEARRLNLKIYEYNEMVGELTKKFKTICVCGCHGKTTTTTMIEEALGSILGMNYLIGDGTGYANKNNSYFALESCEYQRHFLAYHPYYSVVTNVDMDHVDYYKDMDDIKDAYTTFLNKTEKYIIACGDDLNTRSLKLIPKVIYYGIDNNNDVKAVNVCYKEEGITFDVIIKEEMYGSFNLPIYGKHQLLDVLSVITLGFLEGISACDINKNLSNYKNAKRRFAITEVGNSVIIDDYAHHPNEVKSTIDAIKQKYKDKDIIVIFQPHTFSRTKEFYNDFINIFKDVTYSYILNIFPAREKQSDYPNITSNLITDSLDNSSIIEIDGAKTLDKHDNSVFIFMSPNDISKLENDLISLKKERL